MPEFVEVSKYLTSPVGFKYQKLQITIILLLGTDEVSNHSVSVFIMYPPKTNALITIPEFDMPLKNLITM